MPHILNLLSWFTSTEDLFTLKESQQISVGHLWHGQVKVLFLGARLSVGSIDAV